MDKFLLEVIGEGKEYDVVVAGGGLTGVCAAVGAAREGADVLLLEATGALGGMATQGLVPGWCGTNNGMEVIHSVLCKKLMQESCADGGRHDYIKVRPAIDAEMLKRACDDLILESGAKILFNTTVAGVQKEGEAIRSICIANKNGLSLVKGKVFIDCTGDADLAAWAGVEYVKGDDTGDMQPVSHCYAISGVDGKKAHEELQQHPNWMREIIDSPEFPLIKDDFFGIGSEIYPHLRVCNSGHLWGVDNTDMDSITNALVDGRKLALQLMNAYKKYMPQGFAEAALVCTAPLMGVRETRRIIGDYELKREDYDARRRFGDEIAFNTFFIDIHPSLKKRELERRGLWSWRSEKDDSMYGQGEFHAIPYRSLLPKGISNLLVAGRSICADREVLSAVRVMPPCMSMGEAAGIAAAQAAAEHSAVTRAVDIKKVQQRIRDVGGFMPEN